MKTSKFRLFVGPILLVLLLLSSFGCGVVAKKLLEPKSPPTKVPGRSSLLVPSKDHDEVAIQSSEALKARKYEELEATANKARDGRQRLTGGFWKLNEIYRGIEFPNFGKNSAESEWQAHFARLQEWKKTIPESITARIALAQAWASYGFEARGEGYINSVSDENLHLFQERVDNARKELDEARPLNKNCPDWYVQMLRVGFAQGWSLSKYDSVFEEGFLIEPTYYLLQREKVQYLLPQWYGKEGDLGRFITENSARIDGVEGDIMYFELVSTMQAVFRSETTRMPGLNWAKIKRGYDELKNQYGVDKYRKNMFLYLAYFNHNDMPTADAAFKEVGDDWDPDVWGLKKAFDDMKAGMDMYHKAVAALPKESPSLTVR